MTTKLDHELKREITVDGVTYTLSLTAEALRLTEKGRRKGLELTWKDLLSGDAGMAAALQASVAGMPATREPKAKPAAPKKRNKRPPAARAKK